MFQMKLWQQWLTMSSAMCLEWMKGSAQSEREHRGIYDQTLSDEMRLGKSRWYTAVYLNFTVLPCLHKQTKMCLQEYVFFHQSKWPES